MLSEIAAAGLSPHCLLQGEGESSKREETHLGSLFVSALSQTSESAPWESLLSYLKSQTKTELVSLIEQPEVQHYIHRTVRYAVKHSERVEHLGVLDELSTLFPEAVRQYAQSELPYSYSYSDIEKSDGKRKRRSHKRAATTPVELFDYAPPNIPATFRGTQLKLTDLVPASYQVNDEINTVQRKMHHEVQRGTSRGEELREVARLGRPHVSHGLKLKKRSRSVERSMLLHASAQKPSLNPILSSSVDDAHFHKLTTETLFPRTTSPSKAATARPVSTPGQLCLHDGYQTIEAFASGKLKSESESIYLNYADPWRQNPYNLVVVSKTKADPEHFVVSKFGILCVYPDRTSDLQSFAEWLREASLFQILKQIPFLKYYRLKKAFSQWYQNIRFAQFACVQAKFKRVGLRYFATFGKAVLKINNLSQELLSIPFHSLQPLGAYSSESYMHCLKGSQVKFQQFLQRYFKYCRRIITEVVESTQNIAVELETDLRHQPFVSDLPLSVQKEKHQQLARDLEEISYQASRLSDFVSLAEHIVFSCLLAVAHQGAQGWGHTTLGQVKRERGESWSSYVYDRGQSAARSSNSSMATSEHSTILGERPTSSNTAGEVDAMLCISIIIKESGEISTEPSVAEVKQLLLYPLHMIAQSLISCVQPLSGVEQKAPHSSRPASRATVMTSTEPPASTTQETSTPLHADCSQVKKNLDVKQQTSPPMKDTKSKGMTVSRPVPPSMVPARQPKSLLRALKGSIVGAAATTAEGRGGGEGKQELQSERARSQLATATSGDDPGALCGRVQSTPLLMKDCFSATIRDDEVLMAVNDSLQRAVDEACETITSMCDENQWLGDVWKFVNSWQGRSKVTSMSAEELERTFNCLYDWQCLLECLPGQQSTPHSLVCIGSIEVVSRLLPRLTTILEQVKSIGVLQAKVLCERVLQQTKHKTEMLTSKRYDLEGFAEYAHHLSDCQTFHRNEAKHIDYVLRVHSTLRRNGVKVPQEDEALSEELRTVWHTFEGVLREAEQFVTTQTPMKAQGLQQSIESYEEELSKFVQQVNEGKFIDPSGNPLQLLEELKQILEEAYSVRSRLLGLSKWKEAINGKPHDLSRVFRLMDQIVTRQEVWKYRKVFDGYERDWLQVPFKKLDIGLISEKVAIWLEVSSKLEETLPHGDPVLVGWKERLWEFQQGFPLLQQLASKALKVSHWYTIFASLGEDFDPTRQYTLNDFQLYNVYEHSNIIFEICHDAMQQEKLRGKVDKMQSRLEQETLTVLQSPLDRYPFAVASSSPLPTHQEREPRSKQVGIHLTTTTSTNTTISTGAGGVKTVSKDVPSHTRKHSERITSFAIGFPPPSPSRGGVECLLFIDNKQDVLMSLENDVISVKILLASPHLGGLRTRLEAVMKTLLQLKELVGLLSQCQDQWRQLLSLFSSVDPRQFQAHGLSELQEATAKYQEIVKSIQDDPRLLSLLGKRRGQKGFRELQGDALRQCCNKIQAYMETVHSKVKGELERGCGLFPRLCFLGDSDVLRVVSHSGSPIAIMQQIRAMFPAVKTVRFAEMLPSNSPVHQSHDSKEGFQLMGVEGWDREHLSLVAPLPLNKRAAPQWLHALESALSYSLGSALAECHSTLPESLVGAGNTEQQGDDIEQWVSSSLSQAVVLSLEMRWTAELYAALSTENPAQQLRHVSSKLHAVLDTMAELLRSERLAIKCQLSLQNIITVLSHKLEIAKNLIKKRALTPESFEWRCHILYAPDSNSIYNSVQKDRSQQQSNRLSMDYNRMSMASFRGSVTSIYSSHHSLKAGSSNALVANAKLQGSTHSLVASSKSLLSSRNALLAAAGGSDLQKSGTSSLVLFKEPQPPMKCFVHCGESILPYGFEYHSPKAKLILSPISESCILPVINELARFTVPSLGGAALSGKTETGVEVARLLGRHYYQFSCSPLNKLSTLHHLIRGALQAGSLLLLQDSTTLQPHIVASLGEWLASLMAAVAKAFSGKQSSIIFPAHSHQKNISDGYSETSSFSTPRQSRASTSMHSHPADKTTPLNKSNLLKHTTSRHLSVIISEQQLLTEAASRQGTASNKNTNSDNLAYHPEVPDVQALNQSPNFSQLSLSRTQHRPAATSTQPPTSSQPTTRIDWYRLGEESQLSDSRSSLSKPEWFGYGGGPRVNVEFFNQSLQASPGFGCVFVGQSCISTLKEISESFKSALRPVCVVAPDCVRIGEALLLSCGFTEANTLSWSLAQVLDSLKCQLASSSPKVASCISNVVTLKQIISRSFDVLTSKRQTDSMDIPQAECDAVAQAAVQHFESQLMCEETEQMEEFQGHVSVNMDPTNWIKLNEIVNIYFPSSTITSGDGHTDGIAGIKTELVEAIKTQLKEHHLQDLPMCEEKIYQLHRSLQGSKCVVLSGVSGSGKSTSYRSLAGAYHYIRELRAIGKQSNNATGKKGPPHRANGSNKSVDNSNDDYPCVDITVINPAIYSSEELFGSYHQAGGSSTTATAVVDGHQQSWRDGILTRIFKQMEQLQNIKMQNKHPDVDSTPNAMQVPIEVEQVNHWLVLDGPLESGVVEALEMLVKGEGLTLPNRDTLLLPRSCWLLLETPKLTHFTPSLLSHSTLLHFSRDILSYEAIVDTWLDRAPTQHNLSAMSTETLATMIKQLLPETLNYLHETNTRCLGALYSNWVDNQVYGVTETRCFINLLSAVLERNAPKVDSAFTHTGTASITSRVSSTRLTESRASSAMLSAYSTTSMRVVSSFSSAMMPVDSVADVHDNTLAEHTDMADELSECSDLEAQLNLSIQLQMASMLSFAYIWSLGAFVPFSELDSFSEFARHEIMQLPFMVPLPEEGSVFDYFLNLKQYQFVPWSQRGAVGGSKVVRSSGYVPLPEVERFAYIVDLYLSYGLDVMIVGQRGTGKTSFVENLIQSRLPVTKLQMSPTLSPAQLQEFILERVGHLERRGSQRLVGGGRGASKLASSMRSTFFLDDIHLASSTSRTVVSDRVVGEESVCSPVLELARFAVQHHHLFDISRSYSHSLNNVHYMASCTPWEYWKLPHQFSHSFNPVPFLPPSDQCLHRVFSCSVLQWLQQFPDTATGGDPQPLAEALSAASVAVYRSVSSKFHPSPSAPYLLFTMHNLLHVYEGLLLLSPTTKAQTQPQFGLMKRRGFLSSTSGSEKTPKKRSNPKLKASGRKGSVILPSLKNAESLAMRRRSTFATLPTDKGDESEAVSTTRMVIRLWCHESTRVYLDRTADSKDRVWFLKLLEACIKYSFCGIDFKDAQKPSSQRQFGGQTGGGRRVRGGRGRVSQASSSTSSMEGPSLKELISTGIRVDTLKQLMASKEKEDGAEDSNDDEGKVKKLIALDQVTLRGEDLTSLIFAHFPNKSCQPTNASSRESISSEEGEKTTEVAEGAPQTTGTNSYSELGDGQVMEILAKHLTGCSDTQRRQQSEQNAELALHQSRDLVLFKGAIEHAARLCRVMSLPGSHSLLIGAKGSGRSSLIRLVAHIVNAKLFYLKDSRRGLSNNESLRQQLRDICISAAVDGKPTVLVITSSIDIRRQDWEDIYKLMNEGLCPGLFTSSELLVMSSKMQTGRVKKTVEGAQQAFARAVCRQLHVFVLWDTTDGRTGSLFNASVQPPAGASLQGELLREESSRLCFASLYRACSYIDVYQPWSKQDYCDIALRWWQREGRGNGGVKWQEWVDTSSQLEAVGNLAAHVHITTTELLSRSCAGSISDLVSPKTFIECLKMTKKLAMTIKNKEQDDADKLRRALDKLNAIDNTVKELEQQLATLQPQVAMAEQEVQQKMALITAAKERYMAANQRCKFAEETIQRETENMEQLSRTVEEKFNEVSPVYHSALEALISVQKNDILELMSYREPPDVLTPVFNALCMLFDRDQTWEDCKQLLLAPKFFESLKFFDRDNVPLRKLRRLEKLISRNSKFGDLDQGSQAIVPVCTWLIALVDYHYAKMAVQPYKDRLKEAERTLMDANKTFVEMKKDMMETRAALENTVKLHKESMQKQRTIEAEITSVKSKLESARYLLSTISSQRARWDANLKVIHDRIDSVPGHALLCSASVCYLARTPPDTHRQLLTNWLGYCSGIVSLGSLAVEHGGLKAAQGHQSYSSQQQQVVKIRRDFSVSGHLSEKEEQSYWKQESIFPDQTSLERCLAARSACTSGDTHWPFIFDPHQQFESYLAALKFKTAANISSKEVISMAESVTSVKSPNAHSHHHKAVLNLKLFEPNFHLKLECSLQEGNTVLLCMDVECLHQTEESPVNYKEELAFISNVLQRKFNPTPHSEHGYIVETQHGPVTVHPDFQLYLISHKRLEDVLRHGLHCFSVFQWQLSNFCVVNIALSPEGMQSHLQRFIITHEKPEYKIRYKSLLTDLTLHQQQLMDSQEKVLNCMLESEDSLLQATHLLNTVKESESLESSALEQITDTEKSMQRFDKQALAYKPLSELASIILTAIQKLSSILKYFTFGIDKLEGVIVKLISRRKDNKVADDAMAVNANVIYLKYQFLISVHQILQVYMFRRHQILLPFMVAVELLVRQGKMTYQECELLSRDLGGLEPQLDSKLREDNGQRNNIPVWISRKTWCQVLQLQHQVQTFHQLSTEISTYSAEWKEYFDASPYLLGPVPVYFDDCTLGQKLLLWKTFQPEKFSKVCEDFVVMILGAGLSTSQPLSVDLLLPHTSPQIPILCMLPPPSSAGDGCSSSSANPVSLLEVAAGQMRRKLHSFTLLNKEHSDELMMELTHMAGEDIWVVIQHCHLYSNWQQVLQNIVQLLCELSDGEERLHPDFRMWLLLPFNVIDSDLSVDCFKVAFDYIDISGPKMSIVQSEELSSDLQLLYPSQSSTRGKWEEYDPLLLKLQSFIPPTLSYSKLTDLNPQQETAQSLPSLLYEELCVHNSSLMQLQASLRELFTFTSGDTLFTSKTGLALKSIRDNTIPASWNSLLPFPLSQCPELVPALNLLRRRIEYYTRALESGSGGLDLTTEVEPFLFSNPQDMISRILQKFPSGSQIDANLIIDDFLVHQNTDNTLPSIILPNLCLHGARWDKQTTQLTPLCEGENTRGTRCSILLTLKPPHSDNTTSSGGTVCATYDCPVLLMSSGSVNIREATIQSAPKLCTVPLPCSGWEQLTRTQCHELHGQGGHSTSPELNDDECLAVFLSCEWPT